MKQILVWMMSFLMALVSVNVGQPIAIAQGTNLVVNGSFEEPVAGPPEYLGFYHSIPGWQLSEGPDWEIQHGRAGRSYDGEQHVELDSHSTSKIYQDIPTQEDKTYKFSFAFSPRPRIWDNKLNVYWGNTPIEQLYKLGGELYETDWEVYSYGVKATSSTTRASFDNLNEKPDAYGSYVDAVSLEPLICEVGFDDDCPPIIITPNETFILPVKIKIPEKAGTLPLDLMLTQDLTGSFKEDLPILQALIPDLVEKLRTIQPDTTFGLVSFRDKKVFGRPPGNPNYYVYKTELPLTTDSNAFKRAVANLITIYGKDYPESSLSALMQVALRADSELNFRSGTRRVAIVSTDDRYKKAGDYSEGKPNNGDTVLEDNEDYPSVEQVKKAINEANMVPIFLVTRNMIPTYNGLVSQLGVGAVVELKSDSSNLIEALTEALEVINQNLTIVALNDEYDYVESIEPERFENVAPGSTVITNVTFKYSRKGSGEEVTIRALGIGDLVVDVNVIL